MLSSTKTNRSTSEHATDMVVWDVIPSASVCVWDGTAVGRTPCAQNWCPVPACLIWRPLVDFVAMSQERRKVVLADGSQDKNTSAVLFGFLRTVRKRFKGKWSSCGEETEDRIKFIVLLLVCDPILNLRLVKTMETSHTKHPLNRSIGMRPSTLRFCLLVLFVSSWQQLWAAVSFPALLFWNRTHFSLVFSFTSFRIQNDCQVQAQCQIKKRLTIGHRRDAGSIRETRGKAPSTLQD